MSEKSYIYFSVSIADTINLKIYNKFGHVVKTYFDNKYLPLGHYSILNSGSELENGQYYVHLTTKTGLKYANIVVKSTLIEQQMISKKNDIVLYPNPTNDKINFILEGTKNILITDTNGKILKQITTEDTNLSLFEFKNGMYFVTISTPKKEIEITQKIVLQK